MPFDYKNFIKQAPDQPGVYKMLNTKNNIIYIGKAKNLKKRISQYFSKSPKDAKTTKLVNSIKNIEIEITNNETESLILEQTLIKKHKPKYNILLIDDKSYIYLKLDLKNNPQFPSLRPFRINRKNSTNSKNKYYGPYPSAKNLKAALNIIQKTFKIKNCTETFFKNRVRPCLQYQINRCSAPCTKYISIKNYQDNIKSAQLLLEKKEKSLIKTLTEKMQSASENLEYEQALKYRDQINAIKQITQTQTIESINKPSLNTDIIAITKSSKITCIFLTQIRSGQLENSETFFISDNNQINKNQSLEIFFSQYYLLSDQLNKPNNIISYPTPSEEQIKIFKNSLNLKNIANKNIANIRWITHPQKKDKIRLNNAIKNSEYYLTQKTEKTITPKNNQFSAIKDLSDAIITEKKIKISKLSCFDISHHGGDQTVASCVIFDHNGPKKDEYRIFNIKNAKASDDYGAMKEVLTRYISKIANQNIKTPEISNNNALLLVIDGGKGQLSQAINVLNQFNISNIFAIGIAKGPKRKAGLEKIFTVNSSEPIIFPPDSNILHLLQYIRDEAHRFAITHHRKQKTKTINKSSLESIPGIGPKKAKLLLEKFGSIENIKSSSINDLCQTPGISLEIANILRC